MRDQFLSLFGTQSFPYNDEVFALLRSSAVEVSHSSGADGVRGSHSCQHYEETYRRRSQHLLRRCAGEPYWDQLRAAIDELCSALAETPDVPCCLWIIRGEAEYEFAVFENAHTETIVGCLRLSKSMQRPKDTT